MWWTAASAAMQFVGGYAKASLANAQVDIQNKVSRANAANANKVRAASNENVAAQGDLARFVQAENNRRQLEADGQTLEAHVVNYLRQSDRGAVSSFMESIQAAEAEGAAAAAQAASGVTGSVGDMVNGAMALRRAMAEQLASDEKDMRAFDFKVRHGQLMSQMVGGLDNSIVFDALDLNRDTAVQGTKTSAGMTGFASALPSLMDLGRNLTATKTQAAAPISASSPTTTNTGAQFSFKIPDPVGVMITPVHNPQYSSR